MKIPKNVLNPELYIEAKKLADLTYDKPSAYKSMFIVTTYKKLGGKYSGSIKSKKKGVNKWNREQWIQVVPYLESGKKIACGKGSNGKGCRPFIRIDSKTPITIDELIKIHGKKPLLKLAKEKGSNMSKRVRWKNLKISKKKQKFLFNPDDPKNSFDVYIDKNPKDTIHIKYSTIQDIKNTIIKLEKLYKQDKYTHKRIWQVAMIMRVRLGVFKKYKDIKYKNIKNIEKRYELADKYYEFLKKRTKLKQIDRKKLIFTF